MFILVLKYTLNKLKIKKLLTKPGNFIFVEFCHIYMDFYNIIFLHATNPLTIPMKMETTEKHNDAIGTLAFAH